MWQGKRILVVEDEPLIAVDLEAAITDAGATVVGPVYTLEQGLLLGGSEALDGAIVDMNLRGESASALLRCLLDRSIPCIVHSGHNGLTTPEEWPQFVRVISKPAAVEVVMSALRSEMARSHSP